MRFKNSNQRKAVMAKLNANSKALFNKQYNELPRNAKFCAKYPNYCMDAIDSGRNPLKPGIFEKDYRLFTDIKDQEKQIKQIRQKNNKKTL